jgi:1,4-dihydroxy-2-naphthoate octaprenyltransferase
MQIDRTLFEKLAAYPHVVVSWVDDDGYPTQTAASFEADGNALTVRIATTGLPLPTDRQVNVTASHIRPQAGTGYDQRRYICLWGTLAPSDGGFVLKPERAWGWDEQETPFFEYVERSNPVAMEYMSKLSIERGAEVKPKLSKFWTFLVATRLPFQTATIVPILIGIAAAAYDGHFNWWLAALTLIGGMAVHVGLNVANDVFDEMSGADAANVSPTQFSGGSRVIQRGLVTLRQMSIISLMAYAVAIGIGLFLVINRASVELLVIGMVGIFLSVFYTAPPFRLVHHGLGELTTALGFGPVMVLGAYVVQAGELSGPAFVAAIPVAILNAMILYVNEIPDRHSDPQLRKRTLPVRMGQALVTRGFLVAALAAFAVVAVGAITGYLPRPTLLALLALPLAFKVYDGIRAHYNRPYDMMAAMGQNVQLHLLTGVLLFAGYIVAVIADHVMDSPPGILS